MKPPTIRMEIAGLELVIDLLKKLIAQGESQMSKLSDKLDEVGASLDAAISRVQEDVNDLQLKIAELQALVDAGGATPEDEAKLDALKARLDAIDPVKPATLPTP